MNKNTIIGFVLIAAVMIGFSWFNQPSKEETAYKAKQDSIAQVEALIQVQAAIAKDLETRNKENAPVKADSIDADKANQMGAFAASMSGSNDEFTLKNDLVCLTFSSKGGELNSAQLLKYQTHDSLPLYLFNKDEAKLSFTLRTNNSRIVSTNELFFKPTLVNDSLLTLSATTSDGGSLDFTYKLTKDSYMLSFEIVARNLGKVLASNANYLEMTWNQKLRQQEKGRSFEERYSGLYYKFAASSDVEYLSESKDDEKQVTGKLQWIGYKDQFFSTALIANNDAFTSVTVKSTVDKNLSSKYLKDFRTNAIVAFDPSGNQATTLSYYLGPNHYATLKSLDNGIAEDNKLHMDKLVPLGPSFLRWINQYLTIPLFNFFGGFVSNFGIVILLLTLVIKVIIFPLTYKSYMSQAKMRVLRPQINEINMKHPGQDKALERQKATMELYNKVGVSPMSGCLPMLLQMPILFALFTFFPSSIELRQESFLWAKDLSTYDAIVSWETYIPIISPYFGNHISLFCLLMTITNIVYTKFSMDGTAGQEQMPGMKMMQYMMPLMFLVFFNNYSSGLSYYYFISTLITIIQTLIFRYTINEHNLLAKLHENAKKPKKKSAFMQRLEEAQKAQEKVRREDMKKRGLK